MLAGSALVSRCGVGVCCRRVRTLLKSAPCALNGVKHESSSINYARESMLSMIVVFQMQLFGVNGLF